ncbi:alpha/beta hydrolase [Bacillus sp. ISL-18]|uniref:alpha/beta fold hydrolase n=1 Tax=Bacillus sp. ISL-18 TaxID=2819118 RepID=UPI001BE80A6E|nr:alpha/beta hydrolase [Bacillus sp. ISL-18]MBT2655845.1 alpha/beta hydrolase [Bacillus sp. ISL-18]
MPNSSQINYLDLFKEHTVSSHDGTTIGYRSLGEGPGILIIHGAFSDSEDYTELAKHLAQNFLVHIMDRRGRGMSGAQGENYGIGKELEDIQAVRNKTKANFIVGHSYGGLVALEAARQDPAIEKIALYEPGVFIDPQQWQWLTDYELAIKNKDDREAFAHFVRGIGHTPPLTKLPKWYVKGLLKLMVRGQRWERIVSLLPENLNEHREVMRLSGTYRNYQGVEVDTLLMVGGKSSPRIKQMILELERTISKCRTLTIPKTDHFGPDNHHVPKENSKPSSFIFCL